MHRAIRAGQIAVLLGHWLNYHNTLVTSNELQTAGLNRQGKHLGTLGGSSGKPEQWLSFDTGTVKADCRE